MIRSGSDVRDMRLRCQLLQRELAKAVGISTRTLQRIEAVQGDIPATKITSIRKLRRFFETAQLQAPAMHPSGGDISPPHGQPAPEEQSP